MGDMTSGSVAAKSLESSGQAEDNGITGVRG